MGIKIRGVNKKKGANCPIAITLSIRGEIYGPNFSRTKSQALATGHLRKKNLTGAGLSFVAYEILGSTNDEIKRY